MKTKLKAHLWTLPRWFGAPFFGGALLLGAVLAGGLCPNAWIGLVAGLLLMAGGHSWNSFLDYAWTGLDKGELQDRSAEKDYCGGQNIIELDIVSTREVMFNAITWYALALVPIIYLAINMSWIIAPLAIAGMLTTVFYSKSKFNWTHELALGAGVGPLAVLIGMFSVSPDPPWLIGLVVSVPYAIILSFAGLAIDEWPDAEANIKKGVKSIAYKVWENKIDLGFYLTTWIVFIYIYQIFLIAIGILAPLTGLTFLVVPPIIACIVFLKTDFRRTAKWFFIIAALYPILLLVGQIVGA